MITCWQFWTRKENAVVAEIKKLEVMDLVTKSTGKATCEESTETIFRIGQETSQTEPECEVHKNGSPGKGFFRNADFCPICRQEKEAAEQARFEKRFASFQIGKRFHGLTWQDYRPTCREAEAVKKTCQGFARTFQEHQKKGTSLILVGNYGTGKNMLAALIAQDIARAGFTALHTKVSRLIREIRGTWNGRGDEKEAVRSFSLPDLLIIDEVGVQAGSDTEERLLTEIIDDRYEELKPTILLSNLPVRELERYLGPRVMDRFCEGGSRVLEFTWSSWRRRNQAKIIP